MLKNKSVILFLIFFVPLVLSGQIDTNRTVNGFGVTEKTSNINVGFSEMSANSNTVLGSYLSQKFVIGKTGTSKGQITWKKDFKNPVMNIPNKPILIWVYLEKLGNSFPNDSSFTIDIYFLVDSSYFLLMRTFVPGWIYTVWYPIGGVSSSQFGNKKIQGIKFVFNKINVSETIVLIDNLGWTDDAYQVPYILEAFEDTTIVGIENEPTIIPSSFKLYQNYPNPFNPETKIRFELSSTKFVKLQVFDALGREIITLVNEEKLPGIYEVKFDASRLPSGTYFYRLTSGQYSETRKIIYLK